MHSQREYQKLKWPTGWAQLWITREAWWKVRSIRNCASQKSKLENLSTRLYRVAWDRPRAADCESFRCRKKRTEAQWRMSKYGQSPHMSRASGNGQNVKMGRWRASIHRSASSMPLELRHTKRHCLNWAAEHFYARETHPGSLFLRQDQKRGIALPGDLRRFGLGQMAQKKEV